jgi:hypothetical protein
VGTAPANMNDETVLQGRGRGAWIVLGLTQQETGIAKDTLTQSPRSDGDNSSSTTVEHQEVTAGYGGPDQ